MDVKPGISRHRQRGTSLGNTPGWVEEEEAVGETGAGEEVASTSGTLG